MSVIKISHSDHHSNKLEINDKRKKIKNPPLNDVHIVKDIMKEHGKPAELKGNAHTRCQNLQTMAKAELQGNLQL